jgi:actin-like ATPase involved in cell morphogenesis
VGGEKIGLDFGTTTTLISIRQDRSRPRIIPIGKTTQWLPSVAAISDRGALVFGEEALVQAPSRQIRSIKTCISKDEQVVDVDGASVDVGDVIHGMLREALSRARSEIGVQMSNAQFFLGCPALWTGNERRRLADYAKDVGVDIDVADIIDEPIAAGLWAVGAVERMGAGPVQGRTLVFDAGGGTLDVAFLDVGTGSESEFTVLSAEGIAESGDSLDAALFHELKSQVRDVEDQVAARLLLKRRTTELKEALTFEVARTIPLGAPFRNVVSYSRDELELIAGSQLDEALRLVQSVVRGAEVRARQMLPPAEIRRIPWADLAESVPNVFLVGGLSQMPIVKRKLAGQFPSAGVTLVSEPQECVALGLAMSDELDRLNLPRPPLDIVVEYELDDLSKRGLGTNWAARNRVLYGAFTPLYTAAAVLRGDSQLGHWAEIPIPPGDRSPVRCRIRAIAPDRKGTVVDFTFSGRSDTRNSLELKISSDRRCCLKLYANGDIVINSFDLELKGRIARWPDVASLRSGNQNIEIEAFSDDWISATLHDNWRFQ